jgi:hypothetical protein
MIRPVGCEAARETAGERSGIDRSGNAPRVLHTEHGQEEGRRYEPRGSLQSALHRRQPNRCHYQQSDAGTRPEDSLRTGSLITFHTLCSSPPTGSRAGQGTRTRGRRGGGRVQRVGVPNSILRSTHRRTCDFPLRRKSKVSRLGNLLRIPCDSSPERTRPLRDARIYRSPGIRDHAIDGSDRGRPRRTHHPRAGRRPVPGPDPGGNSGGACASRHIRVARCSARLGCRTRTPSKAKPTTTGSTTCTRERTDHRSEIGSSRSPGQRFTHGALRSRSESLATQQAARQR